MSTTTFVPSATKKTQTKFKNLLCLTVQGDSLIAMNDSELQSACIEQIHIAFAKCETIYNVKLQLPIIQFDLRGRRAGVAYYNRNLIRLNNKLLIENQSDFIKQTPGHEAAHLIARQMYGPFIQSHGLEWKRIMLAIGLQPIRCHDFEVKTDHIYSCKCEKKHYLSTTQHNRIQSANSKYFCKNCRQFITWDKLNQPAFA